LMGYRSSFPSKKVKDQTEAVMSYVPDRRKSTNTVRKTQKNTQLGVLRILWNKWNNLFAS
jgi:hypothetical protein